MNKIVERVEREAGMPGLVTFLAQRLAPTDLISLLLEVYRQRSQRRQPADVLSDYESDRFVHPSMVSPLRLLAWEQTAFASLPPGFEPLELSPVCPLGTSSVVAAVDQNWAVTTIRNTEVVSDSSNVLALECALRRRKLLRKDPKSAEPVHMAASHRLLRAQRYENPDSVPHFSSFVLCSAARDQGDFGFEMAALGLHIRFYLKSLRAFLGPGILLRVAVTDFNARIPQDRLDAQLLSPIQAELAPVECSLDNTRTSGKGYYLGLCFHVYAAAPSGRWLELVDGGSVNWTQRLLSSAKERLVISGIGSERVCSAF